jgi:hypothetical protein
MEVHIAFTGALRDETKLFGIEGKWSELPSVSGRATSTHASQAATGFNESRNQSVSTKKRGITGADLVTQTRRENPGESKKKHL